VKRSARTGLMVGLMVGFSLRVCSLRKKADVGTRLVSILARSRAKPLGLSDVK
jgi:hypothetical protein